ncbi:hypothetical protein [[Kitasatospora] papulosa]|uniref:hypothetical protein n=1 Tax=[Kitasatospora] papulosa TaxID=1464011 RepID=UPI0036376BE1
MDALDLQLQRLLTEPSWAQQILTATAGQLRIQDPFLVLTDGDLTATLDMVTELITGHLPLAVAEQAMQRAAAVLPERHYRETCDTYALRLLKAARNV